MGEHTVTWNGQNASGNSIASGVYFVRLEASGRIVTRKIVLLK
jgi:flagellar hook assembly protein FlgD